jgi:hypothetical protein
LKIFLFLCLANGFFIFLQEFLIDKVLMPQLREVDQEADAAVREAVIKLLIALICESIIPALCSKMLEVIGRLMRKPNTRSRDSSGSSVTSSNTFDPDDPSALIVGGLILIFESKAYEKHAQAAIEAYKLLSQFAYSHYNENSPRDRLSQPLRFKIVQFLLAIQTNSEGFVGIRQKDGSIEFSRHLVCRRFAHLPKSSSVGQLNMSTVSSIASLNILNSTNTCKSQFSFEELFAVLQEILFKERDWTLLRPVMECLPSLLANQNAVYSTLYGALINGIFKACLLLYKEQFTKPVSTATSNQTPRNARASDVQTHIFPILTSLVAYRNCISLVNQIEIVGCIHKGLATRECTKQCIIGLTICLAELPDAMAKNLSAILSTLSKTSPNAQLAIAKLEFLSILNLWPALYTSFVIEQFKAIFAIVLPYTSPLKFDLHCVALAYRVAAMWFLSTRFAFRKDLADYIMRQLPENVKMLRASSASKESLTLGDEYRKRSSSLNTENELGSKREPQTALGGRSSAINGSTFVSVTPTNSGSIASAISGRMSSDLNVNGSGPSSNLNSNVNLHSSPSLPSPALLSQTAQSVFSFNVPHDKSPVPPSPSANGRAAPLHSLSVGSASSPCGRLDATDELHMHQVEVFIDLLSRYVAGACSSLHTKDPLTSSLFENGHSATWLLGHKLITVTTSACKAKAVKGDLCDRCYARLHAFDSQKVVVEDDVFSETATDSSLNDTFDSNRPMLFAQSNSSLQLQSSLCVGASPASGGSSGSLSFHSSRRRHQSAMTPTVAASVQQKMTSRDDSQLDSGSYLYRACSSWCPGWAEVQIRGPTGNSCWVMKLQNPLNSVTAAGNVLGNLSSGNNASGMASLDFLPQYNMTVKTDCDLKEESSSTEADSNNSAKLDQINESGVGLNQCQPTIRGRSNTISFSSTDMSSKRNELRLAGGWTRTHNLDMKNGSKLLPNFLFLQFFHQGTFGGQHETPILLPKDSLFEKSLNLFDLITPYETHRIGVVYVGKGQAKDRVAVFRNEFGSDRYMNMIRRLGSLVRLNELDPQKTFIGGLSQTGEDGQFVCIHHEHLVQAIFHVATLMPNRASDPNCNDKNRHIGNNHVCIVYNDSQQPFQLSTLKVRLITFLRINMCDF